MKIHVDFNIRHLQLGFSLPHRSCSHAARLILTADKFDVYNLNKSK